jgi:hypothetical protein
VRTVLTRDVLPALAGRFPATASSPGIAAGRLHSFRHYFCSLSADNGVPEQMLMSWLGHRDSEMIRLYYHQRDAEARRQMGNIPFLGRPQDGAGGVTRPGAAGEPDPKSHDGENARNRRD